MEQSLIDEVAQQIIEKVRAGLDSTPSSAVATTLMRESPRDVSPIRAWLKQHKRMTLNQDEKYVLERLNWRDATEIEVPLNLSGNLTRDAEVGDVVRTQIGRVIAETLSQYDAVRRVSTVISTDSTEQLTLPIFDDTQNSAALLSSSGADMSTSVAPAISSVTLGCYTMQSKPVVINTALIRDAAVDIERIVGEAIAERIGRKANYYETVGTGTSEPTGVTSAPALKTTAATTGFTWDEVLDLVYAVDEAYRSRASFMMNTATLLSIRKILDSQDRPLFWPELSSRSPSTLFGFPVVENPDMPSVSAGNKVIVFGDFSRFVIREVSRLRLVVLNERFVEFDSVGFLAFYYFDCKLQASSNTKAIGALVIRSA